MGYKFTLVASTTVSQYEAVYLTHDDGSETEIRAPWNISKPAVYENVKSIRFEEIDDYMGGVYFNGEQVAEIFEDYVLSCNVEVSWDKQHLYLTGTVEDKPAVSVRKKFTKLFLGDIVKTVGSKVFRKLSTEEPIAEITDLTGTTWYFDVGWTSPAGYGQFNINAILDRAYDESLADFEVAQMMVGYRDLGTPKEIENYVKFVDTKGFTLALSNTRNFILKFTGGVDATNKDLISWVTQSGGVQQGATNLITFTIAGTTYQAEEGMTWGEWYASDYNTTSYYIIDLASGYPTGEYIAMNDDVNTCVKSTERIVSDYQYKLKHLNHGGGSLD